jgi:type IX secretion system substrate protein
VYIMNSAGRLPVDSCNYTIPNFSELRGLTIYVYPSPTSGLLHVAIEKPLLEDYRIMVYDLRGQLLQTTFQDKYQLSSEIDLSRYASGMYLVRVVSESYSYIRKVLKQ